MLRLRGAIRVPEHLRVKMRVVIDEAWSNDEPISVNRAGREAGQASDGNDATIAYADVRGVARHARAVHHPAVPNEQIVFHTLSFQSNA